uniref:Uncharacterized protein n=1 Tax=Romanomermis culicivorax TaxID=13658 RepID=A0A915JHJ0_ROMCU
MPPQTMSNTSNNDEQRTVFDQFCQVCTCMGVIDWYQASHCAGKTFWATLLTVCLLITGYGITISVQRLIDEPPFKTTTSQSRVQNGGVPFPNVTICNYNRVKQSMVDSTKIDPKVLVYMFNWFTTPYDLPLNLLDESQIKIYEQAWMDYVAAYNGNVSIPDILRTYGHGKDMFLSTSHFRRPVTKYEEVISIYGRCWKPEISYNQRMPGSHLGVQMIIDPQFYDYLDNVSINSFLESGIIVSFTYVDEFMIPRPVSVPLGMAAKISLRLSKYTRSESQMPLRKFKCARGSTKLSMISAPYTILNCIFNCNVRAMYERCGCIFFAVTKQPYPLCNMSAVSKCKITDI